METDALGQITGSLQSAYHSGTFVFIRIILGIYVAVLLVDLVLVIILKGLGSDYRTMMKGINMPTASKNKMQKEWLAVKKRLESDNVSQYKVAVLEADMLIDKILANMGFPGNNLTERLEKIQPGQLADYEGLKNAHQVRNSIIHEEGFVIDRKKALETIEVYEKIIRSFELL